MAQHKTADDVNDLHGQDDDVAGLVTPGGLLCLAYLAVDDETTIESARRMYESGVDAAHMGDCTKVAATCNRCLTDGYRVRAAQLICRAADVGVRIERID